MKRNIFILLIVVSILIIFSTLIFASEVIDVKDYIKGKFPVIFNIYLASLEGLDQYEKEFIDLLQNLPEEEQKNFAKEVYNNGFSKEILEKIKEESITEPDKSEVEIEKKNIEEPLIPNTSKWIYNRETDPINDTIVITFTLENEIDELVNDKPIYLILSYKKGKAYVYINWNRELFSLFETNMIAMHIRFNDNKSSKVTWYTVEDYFAEAFKESVEENIFGIYKRESPSQYTFCPGSKRVEFIRRLIDTDRFVAQIKGKNKMDLTAIFDVRGLRKVIEQFNDILHWIKD